jgi:hypothetical protein
LVAARALTFAHTLSSVVLMIALQRVVPREVSRSEQGQRSGAA